MLQYSDEVTEWSELGVPIIARDDISLFDIAGIKFHQWGSARRGKDQAGLHFFTDDYRFSALWEKPDRIMRCNPQFLMEPDFSLYTDSPYPVALWNVYRKRWLTRYWQHAGIRVLICLNVAENYRQLNLQGVPDGYNGFCTRAYEKERFNALNDEFKVAQQVSGLDRPAFIVYGGGAKAQTYCRDNGWLYVGCAASARRKESEWRKGHQVDRLWPQDAAAGARLPLLAA